MDVWPISNISNRSCKSLNVTCQMAAIEQYLVNLIQLFCPPVSKFLCFKLELVFFFFFVCFPQFVTWFPPFGFLFFFFIFLFTFLERNAREVNRANCIFLDREEKPFRVGRVTGTLHPPHWAPGLFTFLRFFT